jgi:hypothetical protein
MVSLTFINRGLGAPVISERNQFRTRGAKFRTRQNSNVTLLEKLKNSLLI